MVFPTSHLHMLNVICGKDLYKLHLFIWFCLSRLHQALQLALAEHQGEVDYLTSAVEQVFQKAPAHISQRYVMMKS